MTGLGGSGFGVAHPGRLGLLPHHDGSGLHAPQQAAPGDEARLPASCAIGA